ncbi:MAG: hypothetical protein GY698_24030 [Actinomycetia bacterium]|nr:hypothetical protein [Actinomycetes bacterium]
MASPPPEPTTTRRRSDAGFVALEWILAITLLLVPAVMLGAGVSRWPEHQQLAQAAAAEADRAAVLAPTHDQATTQANLVAHQVAANYNTPDAAIAVSVDAPQWDWGAQIAVTVTVTMPTLEIPGIGTWRATNWSTTTTQHIEDHRGLQP